MLKAEGVRPPPGVTFPTEGADARAAAIQDGDDALSSLIGFEEEVAYKQHWLERGGIDLFRPSTPNQAMGDPYKELWKMYQKRRALAIIGQEWTRWGLDLREGFFWAGPLAGRYVQRTWMRPQPSDNSANFRKWHSPPLCCDRPEYVKAMVMHWARFTGVLP